MGLYLGSYGGPKGGAIPYWRGTPVQQASDSSSPEKSRSRMQGPGGALFLMGEVPLYFFFFFTLVTGPRRSLSLKLCDTRVYEPYIRARLGTTGVRFAIAGEIAVKAAGGRGECREAFQVTAPVGVTLIRTMYLLIVQCVGQTRSRIRSPWHPVPTHFLSVPPR